MKVEYFRATCSSSRFKKNQKVWIQGSQSNHLYVCYKFRGDGRYISGVVDKRINLVGEIKSIEVDEALARRIYGDWFDTKKRSQGNKL